MQVDNIMKLREWVCVRLSMINKEGRDGKFLKSSFAVFRDCSMSISMLMLRWYIPKLNQLYSTLRCFLYQNILLLHPHPEYVSQMAGAWHRPRDGWRLQGCETEDNSVQHTRVQEEGLGNIVMRWDEMYIKVSCKLQIIFSNIILFSLGPCLYKQDEVRVLLILMEIYIFAFCELKEKGNKYIFLNNDCFYQHRKDWGRLKNFFLPRDGVRWIRRQELLQGGQWGPVDGHKNIPDTNHIANKNDCI